MRASGLSRWLVIGLVVAPVAQAQPPRVTEPAYLRAALVVKSFDHFAAACQRRRGFTSSEAARVHTWEHAHGVARIRARLPELEQYPEYKLQLDQGVATVAKLALARGARDCAAAISMTHAPHAQFAQVAPQLLALEPAAQNSQPGSATR
ncbi:MAG: hypothetical protein FJY56_01325 [Betaproteobacteria bacterium]|nr:hypothetical protein [Betaproteobacteria bacterium]